MNILFFSVLFYLLMVLGEWCALVFAAIEGVLSCSLLCLCTLAGGGTSRCCCSVHLHCSGRNDLVNFLAAGCMYYRALCVGLVVLKS
jgi:hypothetical protein